jgi:CubicO group peptidase (beta-lactamase class C family)
MKRLMLTLLILVSFLSLWGCSVHLGSAGSGIPETNDMLEKLDENSIPTAELEAFVEQVMEEAEVAGLSLAVINDSQIVYQKAFGYKDKSEGTINDEQTLFSAASFSKPVFAYLVMLLAREGVIDLDKPLYQYLDKPLFEYPAYADLEGDYRYQQITARMVLSHTTGFPNWRFLTPDGKLSILFPPGSRHSYSGEGIALLQMIVEAVTGKDLEVLAQEKIFQPLGMTRSSYVWQPEFETNYASPHDEYGRPRGELIQRTEPDAAGSMVTTASDYARFLVANLNADDGRKASLNEMLQPQITINYKRMFGPDAWKMTDEFQDINLSWGLGWGLFDTSHGRALFHTGHSIGWQNYTVTYFDKGIGIVMFSNSDNFESVAEEIAKKTIGDVYSPYDWLGYVAFDPARPKKTPPPDPVAIQVDSTILAAYAGTYDMQDTAVFEVKFDDDRLLLQSNESEGWEPLYAETDTRFFVKGQEDYRFEFVQDDNGTVTALQITYQGIQLPLAEKVE